MNELIEKYKKQLTDIRKDIDNGYNETDGFKVEPMWWDQWIGMESTLEEVINDLEKLLPSVPN